MTTKTHEGRQIVRKRGPRVAAMGGGAGLATMLRGLKKLTENITAIAAVSDDGGGSGVLRQELGILPPGDIRNCLVALANVESVMERLLAYRFADGVLSGQCFGNLVLAALDGVCDSFEQAVSVMGEVLAITGQVLPVTDADVNLEAEFENGTIVRGESNICACKKAEACRIRKVRLVPARPRALPSVLAAIREAEMIVIGPGSLYTSIIPNLLVEGVAEAIMASKALKIYVCNVMTQEGETEGYTASEHLKALLRHSGLGLVDICLVNTAPVSEHLRTKYERERANPLRLDEETFPPLGVQLIGRPLTGDLTTYARHDPDLLAGALLALFREKVMDSGAGREMSAGADVIMAV